MSGDRPPADGPLDRGSVRGRMTLLAVTLGSGIAILDGTVVNIAVKTVGEELDASFGQLQWVINGYMLALASLVLVGGSLGDRLGRRRVYVVGILWFAVGSALCAVAANPGQLIAFRVLQGVGGALATPGALAVIQASFRAEDRAPAIGTWAGMSGVAAAIGPFLGGWLIEHAGWRWIFWINVPLCAVVVWLCLRYAPESHDVEEGGRFDLVGAALTVLALGASTYALTAVGGPSTGLVVGAAVVGVGAAVGFVAYELRHANPMVPLGLFRDRVFSAANGMTLLVYGAMSVIFLVVVLQLQVTTGYGALAAGIASLPITLALMLLSSRFAALSVRIGPRVPMSVGPLLCAAGVLLLVPVGRGTTYLLGVLPGMVVFALGLATLVSPLTATVLAAAPDRYAGVASGINNAVARAGGLLAVAALPPLVGLSGSDYADPTAMTSGYRAAMVICAALLAAGGVVSWFGLTGTRPVTDSAPPAPHPGQLPP